MSAANQNRTKPDETPPSPRNRPLIINHLRKQTGRARPVLLSRPWDVACLIQQKNRQGSSNIVKDSQPSSTIENMVKVVTIASPRHTRLTGAFAVLTGTLPVQNMHSDQCSCGSLPVLPVQPPKTPAERLPNPSLKFMRGQWAGPTELPKAEAAVRRYGGGEPAASVAVAVEFSQKVPWGLLPVKQGSSPISITK